MEKKKELHATELEIIFLYLENPVAAQRKVREIIWQAIRYFGTQTKTANKAGLIQQTFNYRLNYAKTIHLEDALKMLALLQSKKSDVETWKDFIDQLVFSEQVRIAWDDFEKSRQPPGRKVTEKSEKKLLMCQHFGKNVDTLNQKDGRLDDWIAKKYGFGNRTTFWRAVHVMKADCSLLIQALDNHEIKIRQAFFLLAYPVEVRKQLLQKERLKQKNKKHGIHAKSAKDNYLPLLEAFKKDGALSAIEQQTQAPIIKCIEEILQHFFMQEEHH